MSNRTIELEGGRALANALRELPADVAEEAMDDALVAGAVPIRDAARMRALERRGPRRRPETVQLAHTINIVVRERQGWTAAVDVQTKLPYAALREFGHRIVPRGPSRKGLEGSPGDDTPTHSRRRRELRTQLKVRRRRVSGRVPAYPFMRPAADENAERSVAIIGTELGRFIEERFAKEAPTA